MSKFRQFITKYSGKYVDHEGAYGAQCVDLVQKYAIEVLGIGPFGTGNAIGRWENYPREHFERITNTPSFVPKFGDIMIWGNGVGEYGHIGIVIDGNTRTFDSFDQNWPVGSPSKQVRHDYRGVLGVLRFRNFAHEDELSVPAQPLDPPKPAVDPRITELEGQLAACRSELQQATLAKSQMDVNYKNLETDYEQLLTAYDSCQATKQALETDLADCEKMHLVPVVEMQEQKTTLQDLISLILKSLVALFRK